MNNILINRIPPRCDHPALNEVTLQLSVSGKFIFIQMLEMEIIPPHSLAHPYVVIFPSEISDLLKHSSRRKIL